MSEDENVLARWSRLKRQRAQRDGKEDSAAEAKPFEPPEQRHDTNDDTEAAFDAASLPPLESIVAGSDIRAFLQAGVPAGLTRAALRRAWSSDPSIRDFIEMAENQWDFANPDSIPGFGSLTGADDIPQLVAKALGEWRDDQQPIADGYEAKNSVPHSPDAKDLGTPASKQSAQTNLDEAISQEDDSARFSGRETKRALQQEDGQSRNSLPVKVSRGRGHGGALPS